MNEVTCYHSINTFLDNVRQFDVCDNPFESYAFLSVYLKYHPKGDFYFFDVFEDGKKIAIIPFECTYQSKLLNVKKFRFIGYRQFNYEQFICKEEDTARVFDIFTDYLKNQKYHVVLNYYDINDSSVFYKVLDEAPLKQSRNKLYLCPCLHFTTDFESFFKEVYPSSKKRTELRKFQTRLDEIGTFRILTIDDEDTYVQNEKYVNQIYRVHAERFADVYATSFFGSEKQRPYYSDLIESLMKGKKGYLSLLLMDDVVIAFVFCLTNGRTLIDWIPAFDPAYAKYSLGIVQYKMMFEMLCSEGSGYEVFDYSKGSSVYKRKWAKQETANYQFIINLSPRSLPAQVLYWFDKNKFAFKVYLRNKGVLGKVKHILGKLIKRKPEENNHKAVINYQDASPLTNYKFEYRSILNLSVKDREQIISSIYQGYKVESIEESNGLTTVNMCKNSGEKN